MNLRALRIGAFVVVGTLVLLIAVVVVGGGAWQSKPESVVLNFPGSVYGLRPGAPVVFRGVRVGTVESVTVQPGEPLSAAPGGSSTVAAAFSVPVRARIDTTLFASAQGTAPQIKQLVQNGLVARLTSQSLLTGQLYVDLDFASPSARLETAVASVPAASPEPSASSMRPTEIPTQTDTLGSWVQQMKAVDVPGMVADISRAAEAARALAASSDLQRSVRQVAELSSQLTITSRRLDERLGPVAAGATATLAESRTAASSLAQAADRLGLAGDRIGSAAQQVGQAASGAAGLMAPGSPTLASIQRASDELARSAASLRQLTAYDSKLLTQTDATLVDIQRAARALRELAELLEREPQSVWRGRSEAVSP